MWFSCRGYAYRIEYTDSDDGLVWTRDDLPRGGLGRSAYGWDSQAVAYGIVFDHKGTRWMLYNGNNYGAASIGVARWERMG
jgi:hypothetical protein